MKQMRMLAAAAAVVCVSGLVWAASQPNTLTDQEKKDGWVLLFDGKTLDNWNATPELAKVFKVVDGAIKADPSAAGGTMVTKDTSYQNFVLRAEFRTGPDINSGIILRAAPPRQRPAAGEKPTPIPGGPGYELQIRDKNPGKYTGGEFLTGSIVDVVKAPHDVKIVPNQWNTLEATVNGDHFEVVFNGKKVADGHDAKRASGGIGLQLAHPEDARTTPIEFRSIRIKRLPNS
jgi:Domain of Unknown Function (DUF1080)